MRLDTKYTLDLEVCLKKNPDLLSFIVVCYADETGLQIRNALLAWLRYLSWFNLFNRIIWILLRHKNLAFFFFKSDGD